MRSKIKNCLVMTIISTAIVSVSCKDSTPASMPPEESAEGKAERLNKEAELKVLQEQQRLEEAKLAKMRKNMLNLNDYTKEGLEKDTELDPDVREALLNAKKAQQDGLKKKKELMEREAEAKKIIDEQMRVKSMVERDIKSLLKELPAQRAREEVERKEMNSKSPKGMVWIPGGKYLRGSTGKSDELLAKFPEESPAHVVEVSGFYVDTTEVTNAQFSEFVKATGYKTQAEVGLNPTDFPEADAKDLQGGANVFKKVGQKINPWRESPLRWWSFTPGATWLSPEGPGSSCKDRMNFPVVCVSYHDAQAYAKWAGKRLPTEAEWERAARAGLHQKIYSWGDEMKVDGKWMANVYQGEFPTTLEKEDGFAYTAPVKSYPPNAWGVYDMAGNVWEICSDYYNPAYYHEFVKNPVKDPQGPATGISDFERQQFDRLAGTCPEPKPGLSEMMKLRVSKGGSFLCSTQYCHRFRPGARHLHEVFTPAQHTGFRCVKDVK